MPLITAPLYLASVDHYAAVWGADSVVTDTGMKFDKRHKAMHRCTINDANSTSQLTVPIEKPRSLSTTRWSEIIVSAHDRWWERHITALQSAYGRTPFFEFYIDSFTPLISEAAVGKPLQDLTLALDTLMRRLLGIDTPVTLTDAVSLTPECRDLRGRLADYDVRSVEYYQTWAGKRGFTPGMSAVDLLFNMGPESPLVLDAMSRGI